LRQCKSEGGGNLSQPIFRLFGYAGTGKTTLAKHLAQSCNAVAYAAYTGKAALMMQRNGCPEASTIHGLIYMVHEDDEGLITFQLDVESGAAHADLIVIDECSMVGPDIGNDLLSYGKPILVLGDPAQLPPVGGDGFFTAQRPDFLLTEIHRQAAENPIIHMATELRNQRMIGLGEYGASRVVARGTLSGSDLVAADQVLVGKNATRQQFNRRMRRVTVVL
jgi:exodeoxyribonuclease-5